MKKFWLAILILTLAGCGETPTIQELQQMQQTDNQAMGRCYDYLISEAGKEINYVSRLNGAQLERYLDRKNLMSYSIQLVGAATGHSVDPCGGRFDVASVVVEMVRQRGETTRAAISTTGSVVKTGLFAVSAIEVADKLFSSIGYKVTNSGDGVRFENMMNDFKSGDGSPIRFASDDRVEAEVTEGGTIDAGKSGGSVTNNREDIKTTTTTKTNIEN